MLTIIFTAGIIAGVGRIFTQFQRDKKVILEKGEDNPLCDVFEITIWLLALPPLAAMVLPGSYTIPGALFYVALHLPALYSARKLAGQMDRGFDYQRKVGKNLRQAFMLTLAGIGLVILHAVFYQIGAWGQHDPT